MLGRDFDEYFKGLARIPKYTTLMAEAVTEAGLFRSSCFRRYRHSGGRAYRLSCQSSGSDHRGHGYS